jgi:hypothetical protein
MDAQAHDFATKKPCKPHYTALQGFSTGGAGVRYMALILNDFFVFSALIPAKVPAHAGC